MKSVEALIGVHAALLDVGKGTFTRAPYVSSCHTPMRTCDALTLHFYNAYEADRWDGGYVYYCPCGLTFIAIPMRQGHVMSHCMIVGPLVMSNDDTPYTDLIENGDAFDSVPTMTTTQVRALSDWLFMTHYPEDREVGNMNSTAAEGSALMEYFYAGLRRDPRRLKMEQKLREYVQTGNKNGARELLNELLITIYDSVDPESGSLKVEIQELLVLVGRSAIEGGADQVEVYQLCCQCVKELKEINGFEDINSWLGFILHRFTRTIFDFKELKRRNLLFAIDGYINKHISEKIKLQDVADSVNVSSSHFCRLIKEEMNCTFTEYLNHVRVERAKELLQRTDMSLVEIALATGFTDQSYFTRVFRMRTGVSPRAFRMNGAENKKERGGGNDA